MAGRELTATVSAERQVVLPSAIREQMQWGVGTQLVIKHITEGVLMMPGRAVFAATRAEDVFGCLGPVAEAKSVEEMDEGITMDVSRRYYFK